MMPSCDVCPPLSLPVHHCAPALPSLTILIYKKLPGSAPAKPRGGQRLCAEHNCTQKERGGIKHQHNHKSPRCFRL